MVLGGARARDPRPFDASKEALWKTQLRQSDGAGGVHSDAELFGGWMRSRTPPAPRRHRREGRRVVHPLAITPPRWKGSTWGKQLSQAGHLSVDAPSAASKGGSGKSRGGLANLEYAEVASYLGQQLHPSIAQVEATLLRSHAIKQGGWQAKRAAELSTVPGKSGSTGTGSRSRGLHAAHGRGEGDSHSHSINRSWLHACKRVGVEHAESMGNEAVRLYHPSFNKPTAFPASVVRHDEPLATSAREAKALFNTSLFSLGGGSRHAVTRPGPLHSAVMLSPAPSERAEISAVINPRSKQGDGSAMMFTNTPRRGIRGAKGGRSSSQGRLRGEGPTAAAHSRLSRASRGSEASAAAAESLKMKTRRGGHPIPSAAGNGTSRGQHSTGQAQLTSSGTGGLAGKGRHQTSVEPANARPFTSQAIINAIHREQLRGDASIAKAREAVGAQPVALLEERELQRQVLASPSKSRLRRSKQAQMEEALQTAAELFARSQGADDGLSVGASLHESIVSDRRPSKEASLHIGEGWSQAGAGIVFGGRSVARSDNESQNSSFHAPRQRAGGARQGPGWQRGGAHAPPVVAVHTDTPGAVPHNPRAFIPVGSSTAAIAWGELLPSA